MAQSESVRTHHAVLATEGRTGAAAPLLHFLIERSREAFAAESGAFVEAVETGTAPEVGFEDGRRALVLAEAARRAASEGRAVHVGEIG